MKGLIRGFLLQLQFLTRVRIPLNIEFDAEVFAGGVIFAPVVGLIIGLFTGGVYYLFISLTHKVVAGVLAAVIAGIIITGGLHLDGLADTFDGIFSNRPKAKILKIMKDSRLGTNGTLVLILIIISKIGLLLSINDKDIFQALFIMPAISRMNIVWTAGISHYARKEGMGAAIVLHTGLKEIIIATAITVILSAALLRLESAVIIPAAILFAVLFTRYVEKKIGGITGDIIGAVIELTEIIILFLLLALETSPPGPLS